MICIFRYMGYYLLFSLLYAEYCCCDSFRRVAMVQIMPASMFQAKSHTMAAGSPPIGTLGAAVGAACDGPSEAKGPRIIAALRAAIVSPGVLTPDQCAPDC